MDERLENKTERNVEDTQVSESDSDMKSAIPNTLRTSLIVPESDSDDSLPDYSQPIPTFDSQNMCFSEKFSKYSGLPSRIYEESQDFSQCDNNDTLNVPYSQAKCLNDEKIVPKSSSSKYVRSLENLFGDSSHTTGKLNFQRRNKRRKIIATETLDVVGDNTSGCGDVQSFSEIRKWEVTQSSSKKIKVNESEEGTLLKPALQNSAKNKRGKHKICNFNKYKEPITTCCSIEKSSDDESEYIDKKLPTAFKFDALSKKKNDSKSTIKKFLPKITSPENIGLDTNINTGSSMENFNSKKCIPQMPDFSRKPLYRKCKSSSSESSVNLSVKTKKHLKLSKTLRNKSENNLSKIPPEETGSHDQRVSRKVKEELPLNTKSKARTSSENIRSYFSPSPVSGRQSISSKFSRKENRSKKSEDISLPKSSLSNKHNTNLEEIEEFKNPSDHLKKECNQMPDSSRETRFQKYINSSQNLSVKTEKHLQLKTPKDESENSPQKERKSHHQKLPKRVKEKSHSNPTSKAGPPCENIKLYFSPNSVSTKQNISAKYIRKENLKSQSSEKVSVPKSSLYNNKFEETGNFKNSPDYLKKTLSNKREKFVIDRSPSISRKSQNKNNGAHIEESNEILEERKKFRVSHLSLKELENEYKKHKNYLVEIFTGKRSSWRQDEFCRGRASLQDLRFSVSTIPFTDEQLNHLLILLRQTFCRNRSFVPYFDYFMKVMLPEVTTRIFMDLFSLSHDEVLGKLRQLYISSDEPLTFGI